MFLKVKKFLRDTILSYRKFPFYKVYQELSFVSIFIMHRIPLNRYDTSVLVNFKNHAVESFTTLHTIVYKCFRQASGKSVCKC